MHSVCARSLLSVLFLLLLMPTSYTNTVSASQLPDEVLVAQAGGILKVYSNVKGARVFLNEQEIGKTPTIRLLPPGRYRVTLTLQGYETHTEDIRILANRAVTINAQLAKVVGSIEVSANVDGAEVYLDGARAGATPNVRLKDLPAGTYQIEVRKPGFSPYTGRIAVKPNVRLVLKVELTPNAAVLRLTSSPQGATVFVDGEEAGKTPLTLDNLAAGRHALRFTKSGRASHYRAFQVSVGEELDIHAKLTGLSGGIRVKTKESGADVYLEGNLLGQTPLVLDDGIQPGQYSLRVSRPGFADYIQPVMIEDGRKAKISTRLISLESDEAVGGPNTRRSSRASEPLTRKWWFWSAVGVVALGAGGTTAMVLGQQGAETTGDVAITLP